jgi:protein-S-isoprenylcysteine O-methyltransferase Ste14
MAGGDTSGVRFPPPLTYAGGLLGGWLLERIQPADVFDHGGWRLLALALGLAGLALIGSALGLFRRAGTDPLPMRPTTALVFGGPYRFTRNPMYLGMALVYSAVALVLDLPWALLLLPLVLLVIGTRVIAREERYLDAKFGEEYRAYRGRVRRWL